MAGSAPDALPARPVHSGPEEDGRSNQVKLIKVDDKDLELFQQIMTEAAARAADRRAFSIHVRDKRDATAEEVATQRLRDAVDSAENDAADTWTTASGDGTEAHTNKLIDAYRNGVTDDTRRAFRWLAGNMPGDLYDALVKQFTDDAAGYTVAGYWDGNTPVPIAVIAGNHPIGGGKAPTEEGLWAEYVNADSIEDAETAAIAAMRELVDEDEDEDEDPPPRWQPDYHGLPTGT